MLVDLGYYVTLPAAKADVRRLLGLTHIKTMGRRWMTHSLGQYLMWSTFDPSGNQPFADRTINPRDLVCSLGLEPILGPVLLLEYFLPTSTLPRVPTVCDAYAGKLWPRYFLRAGPTASVGATLAANCRKGTKSRPEVVHAVVEAKNLHTLPRYA
jgi:hypothetical protein